MQHATTVSVIHVSYGRGKCLQKTQKLLSVWVDDLNQNNSLLTQGVIRLQLKKFSAGGLTVVRTKTFGLGFKHIKVNVQYNFFI